MNKQLQQRIGELLGKDYFKLEFGCEVSIYFPPYGEPYDGAEYSSSKYSTATFIQSGEPMSFLTDVRGHMYDIYDTDFKNGEKEFIDEEDGIVCTILGTEPTLQDVLLVIPHWAEVQFNSIEGFVIDMGLGRGRIHYDLTKSLFNQTDKVKQQLLELMS